MIAILKQLLLKKQPKDVTVVLDNGHGINTLGKRSPKWPDGTILYEYEFNRDIVRRIKQLLDGKHIKCHILVPEEYDVSLQERAKRVNQMYAKNKNLFLLSIHANAGKGTGWEVWTSKGKTKSDDIATIMWHEAKAEFPEYKMRLDTSDGDVDKEENFYILYNTACPAVLTENFFMDTYSDCKFIMSEEGRERIAKFHVKAIERVIDELY